MFKILKNKKGFTFVEAVLATVLLAFGLWGGIAMFQTATVNSSTNDQRVIASNYASEKMEQIIADKKFKGYTYVTNDNYPNEVLGSQNYSLTRSTNIYEVNPADLSTVQAASGYKRVDITVTWGNEDYQRLNVSTILTDY